MSWAEVKKINSNLDKPLDALIEEKAAANTVGTNADAANASGSVHAKIKELRAAINTVRPVLASGNLLMSADTTRTGAPPTYDAYTKIKEIQVVGFGTIRVSFDLAYIGNSYGGTAYARIHKNGSPVGTERAVISSSFTTFSEDINVDEIKANAIQLYCKLSGGSPRQYSVRNFRVSGQYLNGGTALVLD